MTKQKKLYDLTSGHFRSYSHRDAAGNLITQAANQVPMICWPNGRWCFEANLYIQNYFSNGVSRRDRGGTLLTYATQITPLIRFCFDHAINFHEITDVLFSEFILKLMDGKRSPNTVIAYGRRCLDFLDKVGSFYNIDNFLGDKGHIFALKKTYSVRLPNQRKSLQRTYWHHRSFPVAQGVLRRLPISDANSQRIREAVLESSSSVFIRKRRYAMLELFEITGARRYEISQLRVKDVEEAASMSHPHLKFITAKKRGNIDVYRQIPVSWLDLKTLLEYIKFNRAPVIRNTIGKSNDHGFFFINQNSGKKLVTNTISQEFHTLRAAAKIEEQACAHMYRHAYLSKLFITLKEQHNVENADDFRKILIDTEGLLTEILQYSGHSNIESLMVYMHQAIDSKTRVKATVSKVQALNVIGKLDDNLAKVEEMIDRLPPRQSKKLIKDILISARKDLSK